MIVAFDIETRGKSPSQHGIVAVGLVLGTPDGTVVDKITWKVKPLFEHQTYEQRCLDEFWNKQGDLRTVLERDAIDARAFAHEFRAKLDDLERNFALYLVSDNPTFDAGFINYYLDHFGLDSMQYGADGKSYRAVHDSDSYARGALHAPFTKPDVYDSDVARELSQR